MYEGKQKKRKVIVCRQKEGVLVIDVNKMRRLIPENKGENEVHFASSAKVMSRVFRNKQFACQQNEGEMVIASTILAILVRMSMERAYPSNKINSHTCTIRFSEFVRK